MLKRKDRLIIKKGGENNEKSNCKCIVFAAFIGFSIKTSFSTETPQMETNFTIKTNFPTQTATKTPKLTNAEKQEIKAKKQALKMKEALKEKLQDSYSEIIGENYCMKEITELIKKLIGKK